MIKLGRNSKAEEPFETTNPPENTMNTSSSYSYNNDNPPSSAPRALPESETMARDIKEGRLSGFVGHGTILTGETTFQAMLRVDGHLSGRVASESGTLLVGTTGRVDANVMVAVAVISGTINGDIVATERLELKRSGRVTGNIQAPRLVIEDGALLEGSCSMVKAKETQEKRKTEADNSRPVISETPDFDMNVEDADDYLETGEEEIAETAVG